jgi:hypothetical protein
VQSSNADYEWVADRRRTDYEKTLWAEAWGRVAEAGSNRKSPL